jgi:hypothetical protein
MGSRNPVVVCDGIVKLRKTPRSMGCHPAELRLIEGVAIRRGIFVSEMPWRAVMLTTWQLQSCRSLPVIYSLRWAISAYGGCLRPSIRMSAPFSDPSRKRTRERPIY